MNALGDGTVLTVSAVLPGIKTLGEIGTDRAMLVGADHEIILDLRSRFDDMDGFCARFSDAFGDPVSPSFVVMHQSYSSRHSDGNALLAGSTP